MRKQKGISLLCFLLLLGFEHHEPDEQAQEGEEHHASKDRYEDCIFLGKEVPVDEVIAIYERLQKHNRLTSEARTKIDKWESSESKVISPV